jgi:hypothetical protein
MNGERANLYRIVVTQNYLATEKIERWYLRLSERVGHNLSAPILGWATNFRAAIKGWATKSAHTKYMIFQAPPPLYFMTGL